MMSTRILISDESEPEDQHRSLHQRIIARQDALHDQPADAGQRKHLFDHDRAADQQAEDDAATVTTGISVLRNACLVIVVHSSTPLARAVRMKS